MKASRLAFTLGGLVSLIFLFSSTRSLAVPGDEHWDPQFGWPGTTNTILAITTHNGRLYLGGQDPANATNCALNVWDGSQWSELGRFSGGSGFAVNDLAFVADTLYVAGSFTNVNGLPIKGLARWDGSTWSSVGFTGTPIALAVEGNNLYVGGAYTNAGGVLLTNIGRWDGSTWHALGNSLGGAGDAVRALAVTNGTLYAGGNFTNSGPLAVTNIAYWNGTSWLALGGGVDSFVLTMALKGSDLYVGGFFSKAGSTTANGLARWDGSNWFALGTGVSGGSLNTMAVFGNLLCIGGNFTTVNGVSASRFAVWNGSVWAAAGPGLSASGVRIYPTGTNVYVGGNFLLAGGKLAVSIASWDGTTWSALTPATKVNGLSGTAVRALASDGTNLYAGGAFTFAGSVAATNIGRFDGTNWHALGSGVNNTVNAIAVLGTDVYAAGSFTLAGGVVATHIARWDGTNWFAVGGGIAGTVSALGVRGTDLFVGGNFQFNATDGSTFCIARWDGTNWWGVHGGPDATMITYINSVGIGAIAFHGADMYLGGIFNASNDFTDSAPRATNVMRWDGANWLALGGGVNTNANAIAIMGTNVYVGGAFTNAGGLAANRIAKWDGYNWSTVGGSVIGSGSVNALAVLNGALYAAGSFTNMGGVPINRIARWDGTNWSALGNGTTWPSLSSAPVLSLGAFGPDLFVGGTFHFGGNKPSYFLGRWNETRNFDLVPAILLSQASGVPLGPFEFRSWPLAFPTT